MHFNDGWWINLLIYCLLFFSKEEKNFNIRKNCCWNKLIKNTQIYFFSIKKLIASNKYVYVNSQREWDRRIVAFIHDFFFTHNFTTAFWMLYWDATTQEIHFETRWNKSLMSDERRYARCLCVSTYAVCQRISSNKCRMPFSFYPINKKLVHARGWQRK